MANKSYYVLTKIDESNIDKEISVMVFTKLMAAADAFKALEDELKDQSENPGTYFLDESIYGKYVGYLYSFRNDIGTIILQEASNSI